MVLDRLDRCSAAHPDDTSPCDGPADAVEVVDTTHHRLPGCPRHGARALASITGARVEAGSVPGAAISAFKAAQQLPPFAHDFDRGPDTVAELLQTPPANPAILIPRDRLREALARAHWQVDGIPDEQLAELGTGHLEPTEADLTLIAAAAGVDVAWLRGSHQ